MQFRVVRLRIGDEPVMVVHCVWDSGPGPRAKGQDFKGFGLVDFSDIRV